MNAVGAGTSRQAKRRRQRKLKKQQQQAASNPNGQRKGGNKKKGVKGPASPGVLSSDGTDTRLAKNDVQDLAVANQQPAITIQVPLLPETLYGVCIQYVSLALARGYMARAPSPNYPYWASVYMVNVLLAYVQGTTPQAQTLPYWLQCYGQALAPKTVRCGSGRAFYSFAVSAPNPYIPPAAVTIGSAVYAYEHNLYIQGGAGPDGFPVAIPPAAYSEDNGALAWSSLAQFMEVAEKPHTKVTPLTVTTWSKNVSAFAMTSNPEGVGFTNVGGFAIQAGLEVPIHTPIMAAYAGFLIDGAINPARYAMFTNTTATDSLFSSACFAHLAPWKFLGTKKNPRFHALDFLEAGDIIAQWVSKIQSIAAADASTAAAVTPAELTCPLSLQEMLLLLRNEIMYAWTRSQVATQSLYPRAPSVPTDNEFVPFICSSSTVALQSTGMRIPRIFVENINSLQARWIHGKSKNDGELYCPILGQYALDNLSSGDYKFSILEDGTPTDVPSFATLSAQVLRKRRLSKGTEDWAPEIEAPISFIDGTSGANYVFINDPTRLKELSALWNEWLNRLTTYSTTLASVRRELGVNICSSVGTTRHWIVLTEQRKAIQAEMRDLRVQKKRHLSSTVYSDRQAIAVSSHDKLISAPFDQIQSMWWLPINHSTSGTNNAAMSIFQRMQIISQETFSSGTSSENAGIPLSDVHANYASALTKGPLAPDSEIDKFFATQSEKGDGGVLSGLVAGFLGKAFGPTAGSIAGSVAEMLPI